MGGGRESCLQDEPLVVEVAADAAHAGATVPSGSNPNGREWKQFSELGGLFAKSRE